MEYEIKKLAKSQVEIKLTVPTERMAEYRKKACEDIASDVKIKGFRPGKVPLSVLEKHVDPKLIDAHTQEVAIQQTYAEAVIKENIQVVARPKIKIESDEPLTYIATVAVLPEVEVIDHKSIKLEKKNAEVTEKDIEEVLEEMKKYATTYKDTDRAVMKGDRVEIDFEGFDTEGKAVENTASKNHPVVVGSGSLIPGFEEEIIGLKKDEEKEFDITFPKDYGKKEMQGRVLKFKVKVNRIEEPDSVEINEEFIGRITGKKQTLEEFKEHLKKDLGEKKEHEAKLDLENQYIEELLKKVKVELPEEMIEEEIEHILEEMKRDIEAKGMAFDKFLEQAKTNIEDLVKKYTPEAEKRIKIRLALRHLIHEEKIEVTDAEIQAEFDAMKLMYTEQEMAQLEREYEKGGLKMQLANRLALRSFFDRVLK